MTKGVRIYKHDDRIHHRVGGERPNRQALPSTWSAWIGIVNNYKNRGLKMVAVGCEEGAMAVHFVERVR